MHIAIITAGGAGMFCGSCMHDNTWARSLMNAGAEVSLIPTYTPLRLDEKSASLDKVFLGGLNVYFNGKFPWWQSVPRAFTRWLDRPGLIRWATSFSVSNNAAELGDLTLSMLTGDQGPHREAICELAGFLKQLRPDVIVFSNVLLAGAVTEIKRQCDVTVIAVLQGDDVFLDGLPDSHRSRAIELVSEKAQQFDGFLTHSRFYRDYMSRYLSLPIEKVETIPLGINLDEHPGRPSAGEPGRYIIGYFARMAREKGLHLLAEAFPFVKEKVPGAILRIGGYQGKESHAYLEQVTRSLSQRGLSFENIGSPDTFEEKIEFFTGLDVFSVPTEFLEPKGMPVLEAMANGVPVVQPAHGAFPEMLEATQGGLLVSPRDPVALAQGLIELSDPAVRARYAQLAWEGVRREYNPELMAQRTFDYLHTWFGIQK